MEIRAIRTIKAISIEGDQGNQGNYGNQGNKGNQVNQGRNQGNLNYHESSLAVVSDLPSLYDDLFEMYTIISHFIV